MRCLSCTMLFIISLSLAGCLGLQTPEMQPPGSNAAEERVRENDVILDIKCELYNGYYDSLTRLDKGNSLAWLRSWGAKVTMKLTVDEKASLNPGLSFNRIFPNNIHSFSFGGNVTTSQSFALNAGLQASTDATRTEIIDFTYSFAQIAAQLASYGYRPDTPCPHSNGILLESDLKIRDFLLAKAYIASVQGTVGPGKGVAPFGTLSDEITFIVLYGGNVTPTWKLVDVTGSNTAPFFNTSRSTTQDVTVSLGPVKIGEDAKVSISPETQAIHNDILTGQFTATSNQSHL